MLFFGFVAIVRAEGTIQRDNSDFDREDELLSKETIKTFKVWFYDLLSWCLLVWIFGRSIM